ncbi:MAG: DUF5009 domain-containing protein [Bacteroidia bacterium]|nr:DUF5009 domain-containing protein [Bacteroidia bacterium]
MKTERILSIDIFRGLTIFMMVFVNELAAVSGIPAWMKHVAADVNGMTFVDVVFPAFLFIVGMSIPFAVSNRLAKDSSKVSFWKHTLIRTLGLIILGVYMVNAEEMNAEANLIPKRLWSALLYIAAILIWNNYPKSTERSKQNLYTALKIGGILILIALFASYRKGSEGDLIGMTPSWWGILGLIGWAYLIAILAYMAGTKKLAYLLALFLGFIFLIAGLKADVFGELSIFLWLKSQSGHLVHSLIVISGILCSAILRGEGIKADAKQKIAYMLLAGMLCLILAYFMEGFGGISKIKASLSWALYSSASCFFIFPLVYWLVDMKGRKSWANFLKPAGTNPLLTYILPALFYAIAGYGFIPEFLNIGFGGIMRSLLFSFFILFLADQLTKRSIRLQL